MRFAIIIILTTASLLGQTTVARIGQPNTFTPTQTFVNGLDIGVGAAVSGHQLYAGVTSGGSGFAANDIAGTAILYLLPVTNGTANQILSDSGVATCPTLASGAPALCHQLVWTTAVGTPASPPNSVPFNNAGAFGGSADFEWVNTALATPAAPVVTVLGTPGMTTWGYTIAALSVVGSTIGSTETQVATGAAVLNGTDKNSIATSVVSGSTSCNVYRSTGTAPGWIGNIACGATLVDTGLTSAGLGATIPVSDTTSGHYIGKPITQGDLGDFEYSAYFGTPVSAMGDQGYDVNHSKFVFAHAGTVLDSYYTVSAMVSSVNGSATALQGSSWADSNTPLGLYGQAGSVDQGFVPTATGLAGQITTWGNGIVTNGYAHDVFNGYNFATGSIANQVGYHTPDLTRGTATNIGFETEQNAGSGSWAFYGAGTAASHLGGTLDVAGGSANLGVCWKSDGKTLGNGTIAEITAGTCH